MIRFTRVILVVLISAIGISAEAGSESVGNGGDAIRCFDATLGGWVYESLDLFEERRIEPGSLIEPIKKGDVSSELERAFTRLSKFSPQRAAVYRRRAQELLKDPSRWLSGRYHDITQDYLPFRVQVASSCRIDNVAVFRTGTFGSAPVISFYKEVFSRLSSQDQAAAIIHELMYSEVASAGVRNSSLIRAVVAVLFRKDFESMSLRDFIGLIKRNGLSIYEANGALLAFEAEDGFKFDPQFNNAGVVVSGYALLNSTFHFPTLGERQIRHQIHFDDDGRVQAAILSMPTSLKIGINRVVVSSNASVAFYATGGIRQVTLAEPALIRFKDGSIRRIKTGSVLVFDTASNVLLVSTNAANRAGRAFSARPVL
ncbi:MAG TPA: hypothetical protein VM432_07225 [Bdellovibrionales bacterium]|nr:hypothetical protein [Bdellovibrionales bacterium]